MPSSHVRQYLHDFSHNHVSDEPDNEQEQEREDRPKPQACCRSHPRLTLTFGGVDLILHRWRGFWSQKPGLDSLDTGRRRWDWGRGRDGGEGVVGAVLVVVLERAVAASEVFSVEVGELVVGACAWSPAVRVRPAGPRGAVLSGHRCCALSENPVDAGI